MILPFAQPIHVLGGGSIGLLFATSIRIAFPSYPLQMMMRSHHESRLEIQGRKKFMQVCLTQQGRPRVAQLPATIIGSSSFRPRIRNLLLATKAIDCASSVDSIRHYLEKKARIIILCNGALAVREEVDNILSGQHPITLLSTTHGACREPSEDEIYHVTHAGVGKTFVQDDPALALLLTHAGLMAESTHDIEDMLWLKLAANCTINPLTALLKCTNGQLTQQPLFQRMAPEILEEVSMVSPDSERLSPPLLREFVDQVIVDTERNQSSMLQDVLRHRPTEIEYLNGYVVRKGAELGVETPANLEIYHRVTQISALPG
jgi:2-dehydropantoate 2-reductase